MSQRVYRDVQRQLLTIVRADAFALVASVVGAESATETIFAHHGDKIALVKEALELNIARFV